MKVKRTFPNGKDVLTETLTFSVNSLEFIEFVHAFPNEERYSIKALNDKGFKNLYIKDFKGDLLVVLEKSNKGEKYGN